MSHLKVRARDVRPYHHAFMTIPFEGGEPGANAVCGLRWSEDGEWLWLYLDSHNTYKARPDEELELVDISQSPAWEAGRKLKGEWVLPPPPPSPSPRNMLALRALRAKRWKWCEGMLPRHVAGEPEVWRTRVGWECSAPEGLVPDLYDPATVGALLAHVREVYLDPNKLWGGWVEVHCDHRFVFYAEQPYHTPEGELAWRHLGTGSSEVEALVAALETAP